MTSDEHKLKCDCSKQCYYGKTDRPPLSHDLLFPLGYGTSYHCMYISYIKIDKELYITTSDHNNCHDYLPEEVFGYYISAYFSTHGI